jgi:hypothetical protein
MPGYHLYRFSREISPEEKRRHSELLGLLGNGDEAIEMEFYQLLGLSRTGQGKPDKLPEFLKLIDPCVVISIDPFGIFVATPYEREQLEEILKGYEGWLLEVLPGSFTEDGCLRDSRIYQRLERPSPPLDDPAITYPLSSRFN